MLFSSVAIHFAFFCFVNSAHGLERLSRDVAASDSVRHVVNEIFSNLKIKVDEKSKIKEYSKIHKYFVRLTRLENNNWKELLKVTRADIELDNGTTDFTTVINEVLNEDNKTEAVRDTVNEENVNRHIEYFLGTLAKLKDLYLRNNSYITINNEVLHQFHKTQGNNTESVEFHPIGSDEDDVWIPSNTRRIYQGERTKIRMFPFVATVLLFNHFSCAGSVIEQDLVITAASCLQIAHNNRFYREKPAFLSVRVGSSFYNGAGEVVPVLEVYFHPSYDPKTLHNNLAIMRLERSINLHRRNRYVKKILLDTNAWALSSNTEGITIIGWGAKTTANKVLNAWENKISQATLDFYPLKDCQEIYSREFVTQSNFCAGFISRGGGACNRDVGAPGVINGILTGVVSFGSSTCGTIDAPTVFTKLGFYSDWIDGIMEQEPAVLDVRPTTHWPLYLHTIMSTRPMRETHFLIEPMDAVEIKSINEMDLRMGEEHQKSDEALNSQSDLRDKINKYKKTKRKKNKTVKGVSKHRDGSSSETSYEPLQSLVTKIEMFDAIVKSSNEANKAVNNDEADEKPITDKMITIENRPITDKMITIENIPITTETQITDKSKEIALREIIKDAKTNTNINDDDNTSSDTDKEYVALEVELENNITTEAETTLQTPTDNLEVPSSREIVQAIQILNRAVNRPKTNKDQSQKSSKNVKGKEVEIENQIDTLFYVEDEKTTQSNYRDEKRVEEQHKPKIIEDTKFLEMLNKQADDKKLAPTDDNILTLLYLSDNERNAKDEISDKLTSPKNNEGMKLVPRNVNNITFRSQVDQRIDVVSKNVVYDILAEAMGLDAGDHA